jgi:hypothetical protein
LFVALALMALAVRPSAAFATTVACGFLAVTFMLARRAVAVAVLRCSGSVVVAL